ncbi:MAG: PIN domain-containing protein [Deltaproteobacteria bacterium]|nr:PIN domain-containing protein [Deltaproteobacteria bacterium]
MIDDLQKVIVDTSVFVDFFRGRSLPAFQDLLLNDSIILSSFVKLEILQGVRKEETKQVGNLLGGIKTVPFRQELFTIGERLLFKIKGKGLTVGLVDLFIAAEALILDYPVYSFDNIFHKLAQLQLIKVFHSHS